MSETFLRNAVDKTLPKFKSYFKKRCANYNTPAEKKSFQNSKVPKQRRCPNNIAKSCRATTLENAVRQNHNNTVEKMREMTVRKNIVKKRSKEPV